MELIPIIAVIVVFFVWPRMTKKIAQKIYLSMSKNGVQNVSWQLNWAIRLTLRDEKLLMLRSYAYMRIGDYQKALRDLNGAVARDRIYLYPRGVLYAMMDDYTNALEDFEYSRMYFPRKKDGYIGAIDTLIALGRLQEALEIAEQFVQELPTRSEAFLRHGRAKAQLGDIEAAILDFTEAISLNAKLADAYLGRSVLYMCSQQHELAWADLESALEIRPDNVVLLGNRIFLTLKEGQQDQALEEANAMVEKFPQEVAAFRERAVVYMVMGRYQQAEEDIDAAEKLGKNEAQNLALRGQFNLNQQDFAEAICCYKAAMTLDLHQYEWIANLAIALYLSGALDEAIRQWKQALVYDRCLANEAWVGEYYCLFEHKQQAAVQLARAVN